MTASDVLVAAPWAVFGIALAVMFILLLRSRRANGQQPQRSRPPAADPDGPAGPDGPAQAAVRPGRCPGRAVTRSGSDQQRPAVPTPRKRNAPEGNQAWRR